MIWYLIGAVTNTFSTALSHGQVEVAGWNEMFKYTCVANIRIVQNIRQPSVWNQSVIHCGTLCYEITIYALHQRNETQVYIYTHVWIDFNFSTSVWHRVEIRPREGHCKLTTIAFDDLAMTGATSGSYGAALDLPAYSGINNIRVKTLGHDNFKYSYDYS